MLNNTTHLPFIVGVSGHRDVVHLLDESESGLEGVKNAIKDGLLYWRNQVGEKTPFWLLSGMAEGADLLAVVAAEELIEQGWSAELLKIVPCLPMEKQAFYSDFQSSSLESRQLFNNLYSKYQHQEIVVKNALSVERYQSAMLDSDYGSDRNSLYLNQGAFIARYSNVLLGIWDGYEAEGVGGTADVIKLKLGENIEWPECTENPALKALQDFDGQMGGIVQHIPVCRAKTSSKALISDEFISLEGLHDQLGYSCYVTHKIGTESSSELKVSLTDEFSNLLTQLRFFNCDVVKLNDIEVTPAEKSGLSDSLAIFQVADKGAMFYQKLYRQRMHIFFFATFLGLAAYELVPNFLGMLLSIVFNASTLIAIVICWWLIRDSFHTQLKWKYQLCRGVAEAMRIRGFLNLADIAPDDQWLTPRRDRQFLPLFNQAIAIAEFDWWKHSNGADSEALYNNWLLSQYEFLESRLQSNSKISSVMDLLYKRPLMALQLMNRWAKCLFVSSVCMGFLLLTLQTVHPLVVEILPMNIIYFVLVLFIQYGVMAAGAMALWVELAGYKTTVVGYKTLQQMYLRAMVIMNKKDSVSQHYMLKELAREALSEHWEWTRNEIASDLKYRK
ncbi:hypothetical protein [Vibrio parahaemolyticus]|uniref:hypothetical protein n=1 Tax=Vibrio parahaemolyticus TaxID=670 RepID=UPI0023610F94|nr:hypothetical protein [Vibrio parahaemolyticus]